MPKYNINDTVKCGIHEKKVVRRNDLYDTTICLRIIGFIVDNAGNAEYVAYLPREEHNRVQPTLMVGTFLLRNYNIHDKYLSVPGVYLRDNNIMSVVSREDGAKCRVCTDFVYMAEADCEDGTFVCRRCRENPYV
jgi:hypothetical protein